MKMIPAIDLRHGKVVRLEQGDDARQTVYGEDPGGVLEAYGDAGVELVHVIDLDAAFGEPPQRAAIMELARFQKPAIEVGGGLRDADSVTWALEEAGVARVILGSMVLRDPQAFARIVRAHPGCVIPALEAKDGALRDAGWQRSSTVTPESAARRLRGLSCPAVLVTDIARDGLLGGPNLTFARDIARWSGIPAILSGGVHSLEDLVAARAVPEIGAAIVGKALYDGRFTVAEALAACGERASSTCCEQGDGAGIDAAGDPSTGVGR